jgi:L-fuconolactonase
VIDGRVVVDAHCHVWRRWPYPDRPAPVAGASTEALLATMDSCGVDRALLVAAATGSQHGPGYANDDNNHHLAEAVARHPDRLDWVVDVDSWWMEHSGEPGAGQRLADSLTGRPVGFTHYTRADQALLSTALVELFEVAAAHGLLASLPVRPAQYADLRLLAGRFPTVPVLVHHLGEVVTTPEAVDGLVAMADVPSIRLKFSGYHSGPVAGTALADLVATVSTAYPGRVVWGSDHPLGTDRMTYASRVRMAAGLLGETDALGATVVDLITSARAAQAGRPGTP